MAGDSAVSLSRWQRHYKVGWVRDLQFVTPLKMRMGPAQTLCIQSQRFKVRLLLGLLLLLLAQARGPPASAALPACLAPTPVHLPRPGPPLTLQVYRSDRLVFETSQVMTDIPYSDHFRVESRWDVEPADQGGCRVQVQVRVPFSKVRPQAPVRLNAGWRRARACACALEGGASVPVLWRAACVWPCPGRLCVCACARALEGVLACAWG